MTLTFGPLTTTKALSVPETHMTTIMKSKTITMCVHEQHCVYMYSCSREDRFENSYTRTLSKSKITEMQHERKSGIREIKKKKKKSREREIRVCIHVYWYYTEGEKNLKNSSTYTLGRAVTLLSIAGFVDHASL